VKTPEQARSWIRLWAELRGVPVRAFTLCEYLPGRDFGCQSLWRDGRLLLVKTFERVSYFAAGGTLSGTSSVAALAKTVEEPRVVDVVSAAIRAVDPRASGMYQTDCKENADGVPCVTEINAGRFGLSTPLFDLVGRHNMAVAFVRVALGRTEAFTPLYDVAPGHYLVRDLDTLPRIFDTEALFSGIKDARGG
jgi:carbamoyl-phosphate synthase large subunit